MAFGHGYLAASGTYELERRAGTAEPLGHGVCVHSFAAGAGSERVEVQSVGWLGDEEEAAYYEPSPERQTLDELALDLRDPASQIPADEWASTAQPYRAETYRALLSLSADLPPYGTTDISAVAFPANGPLEAYGEEVGATAPPLIRCGTLRVDEAAALVQTLSERGFEGVGLDMASFASLDWAESGGRVDLGIVPVMPDGFPTCAEAAY